MKYTRREFARLALAVAPAAAFLLKPSSLLGAGATPSARPNSKWAGVQVGLNVPYSFGTRTAMTAEDILARCIELGVSGMELRAQAIEKSFGLPENLMLGPALSDYQGARARVGDIPGITPIAPPWSPLDTATCASNHGDRRWPGSSIPGLPVCQAFASALMKRVAG